MQDRLRQALVLVSAIGQFVASTWVGTWLEEISDRATLYFVPANYAFAVSRPIFIGSAVYAIYQHE